MKAEERHKLHRDPLADWLADTGQRMKPYARAIVGVIVAVLVLVGVYFYFTSRDRHRQYAAADQFLLAVNRGDRLSLEQAIRDNEGSDLGTLSRLVLAQSSLDQGANQLFTDKVAGTQSLREAASDFGQITDLTHDPLLRAWAFYGLGQARESLNELGEARAAYKELIDTYPDSAFVSTAKQRLSDLERPRIKEFYDWFATQNPVPPARLEPGIPGQKPGFDLTPPAGGIDLSSPKTDGVDLPSNLGPTPENPSDLPKLPQPGTDIPKAEEPKTEAPMTDLPKAEAPKTESSPDAPAKKSESTPSDKK